MSQNPILLDPSIKQFIYALHVLFEEPSLVLIQGETWKDGKTDFGLYISEWLKRIRSWFCPAKQVMPIVSEIASNIDTFGSYPQITDLVSIKRWLFATRKRKLFICDEMNEHMKSRRPMSNKNVGFIDLIPQISKAHGRLIAIGHDFLKVDSELLSDVWCKGIFIKQGRKNVKLICRRLPEELSWSNLPKTSIKFDPYSVAPLTEFPTEAVFKDDEKLNMLAKFGAGWTFTSLGFKHPQQFNRELRRAIAYACQLLKKKA